MFCFFSIIVIVLIFYWCIKLDNLYVKRLQEKDRKRLQEEARKDLYKYDKESDANAIRRIQEEALREEEEKRKQLEFRKNLEQHEQQKREEERQIKRQMEQSSNYYFNKYKDSDFVKEVVADMKKNMPSTPYNWKCRVEKSSIDCRLFYDMGYENLSTDAQVYALARAVAYNLGDKFEVGYHYVEYQHRFEDICVRYTVEKPLKKI